jgi:hypothetical protein
MAFYKEERKRRAICWLFHFIQQVLHFFKAKSTKENNYFIWMKLLEDVYDKQRSQDHPTSFIFASILLNSR